MQSLEQLKSGALAGSKSVKLACGLKEFPQELFQLSETLELLDLSGNQLTDLPIDFWRFKKLKIAFFSENLFTEYPAILSQCPLLEMVGFKSNQISQIAEDAISANIRWLILTNNKIEVLPASLGKCIRLQKVALAGNQIRYLPDEMKNCSSLELLRVSANQLQTLPVWLFQLPRLSWLAYADNPCCHAQNSEVLLPEINWSDLELKEKLGEGASGIISKAIWKSFFEKEVAVKVFKGEVTSDGLPLSEMNACAMAGNHPSLVTLLGKIMYHPRQKDGLLFELIPSTFKNLGQPPSFESCTRDTYEAGTCFSLTTIALIALHTCSVMEHLHNSGIMHGDLYAHNIMVDQGQVLLGDFGAATLYQKDSLNASIHESLDVRAFGCLLDDLLNHIHLHDKVHPSYELLTTLRNECMLPVPDQRPLFSEIYARISDLVH